jgi:DNA-binding transcriptional LysR family regulator
MAWRFRTESGEAVDVPVQGRVAISSALGVRKAALSGLGLALLPDWLVGEDLAAGRLADVFPHHEVTATSFDTAAWLVYPSRAFIPGKVRAAIDFLRQHIGRPGAA